MDRQALLEKAVNEFEKLNDYEQGIIIGLTLDINNLTEKLTVDNKGA